MNQAVLVVLNPVKALHIYYYPKYGAMVKSFVNPFNGYSNPQMTDFNNSGNKLNSLTKQVKLDDAYFRSIIENNSFYIIRTDLDGNYTYLNPFFCKMLSIKAEEYLGRESLSLIMPVDHQACIETVTKCFEDPDNSFWVILRKPVPNGILST